MRDAAAARRPDVPADRGAEWVPRATWQAPTPLEEALKAATAPQAEAVEVVGNFGRWVVQCPDCSGAQLAARDDHRFLCNECGNVAIEGLWRPTIWPADVDELEAALDERLLPENRNWTPGETPQQLRDEAAATVDTEPVAWEGHTHSWPSRLPARGDVACSECHLILPVELVREVVDA